MGIAAKGKREREREHIHAQGMHDPSQGPQPTWPASCDARERENPFGLYQRSLLL